MTNQADTNGLPPISSPEFPGQKKIMFILYRLVCFSSRWRAITFSLLTESSTMQGSCCSIEAFRMSNCLRRVWAFWFWGRCMQREMRKPSSFRKTNENLKNWQQILQSYPLWPPVFPTITAPYYKKVCLLQRTKRCSIFEPINKGQIHWIYIFKSTFNKEWTKEDLT